ncbi:hypothetical protein [Nocardia sp. NBC_01009]|uniref:hypothetical protein n=1 Tax=Nocardia sp. NBC_01009 TaxID=2975996 RepID=UPI00386B1CC4|nr:hypothetical protein OHA42_10565 [Nocardia sp. NBC_01009]
MTNRRLALAGLLALPALAGTLASGATATAAPGAEPPTIEVFTLPGTVSATFHNPNDRGVCWAFNEATGEIFGGNNPTSFAEAGQTVQSSLGGLPTGQVRVRGACAWSRPTGNHDYASTTDVIIVDVTGKPPTGSFG